MSRWSVLFALFLALPALAADPWAAAVDAAWADAPALGVAVMDAEPRPTRALGLLRFAGGVTDSPDAVPFLVDRLTRGDEDPAVRRALADRVGRGLPGDGEWLVALLAREDDAVVRTVLVFHLRRADPSHAVPALRASLADPAPAVRAEAVLAAGMHREGARLIPSLRTATTDEAAPVRARAIQVLGWLGDEASIDTAESLLADPDPTVRKRAEGALERLGR